MNNQPSSNRAGFAWYLFLFLVAEKVLQHAVVTIAFLFDITGIRSTVAVRPDVLMVSGGIVCLLFVLAFWGLVKDKPWALNLVMALAAFDIAGEFVAQGRIFITVTVSILVAMTLLILCQVMKRRARTAAAAR